MQTAYTLMNNDIKAREPHDSCNILLFTHLRLAEHNLTLPFPFTGSTLSSQHGNEAAVDIVGAARQSPRLWEYGLALTSPATRGQAMTETTTTGQ